MSLGDRLKKFRGKNHDEDKEPKRDAKFLSRLFKRKQTSDNSRDDEKTSSDDQDEIIDGEANNEMSFYDAVEGGKLGDRDDRTRHGLHVMILRYIALGLMILAIPLYYYGNMRYDHFMKSNTTPAGTELTFGETEAAKLKIVGTWTDKYHEALVVRLNYPAQAHKLLSSNGSDYALTVVEQNLGAAPKNLRTYYGLYGTDGDGYLVMTGNFTNDAFQVFIRNKQQFIDPTTVQSDNENTGDSNSGEPVATDDSSKTVTGGLAAYRPQDMNNKGVINYVTKSVFGGKEKNLQSKYGDTINFRVNPYSAGTKHIKDKFINPSGNVNWANVIHETTLKPVLNDLKNKIRKDRHIVVGLENSERSYKERLRINKDDENAKTALDNIKPALEKARKNWDTHEKMLSKYQGIVATKEDFGKMQTSFLLSVDDGSGNIKKVKMINDDIE